MRSTSEALRRALGFSPAGLRPISLAILSAPLLLSACATSGTGTATATAASVDAYGYAPVRISAFADGSRIALPSAKPDAARIAATAAVEPAAAAPAVPAEPRAALEADVAERKAATVAATPAAPASAAPASDAIAAKAAASASLAKPSAASSTAAKPSAASPIAAVAEALNPVEVVPASIAAVGGAAGAVTTAAVETTAKAYDAVSERLGDTFKGRDTITGDAAIDRMIERAAADNDIPSDLAYAVVRVESHYNPKAKGSGVYGLSQIQPATARSLGFSGDTSDLYDPETNLRYGMKYLAGAWQKSGKDICGAAMKYKGGHRTTRMSKSAAAYCANVKRHMAAIERRRGPANRETIVAANERQKQIAVAAGPAAPRAAPDVLPGVEAAATPVTAAAATPSGRSVAASATPVPQTADTTLGASLKVASETGSRGGRVSRTADVPSAPQGLAN